jgi:uncharacterized protein YhhL (DUF1145 family)
MHHQFLSARNAVLLALVTAAAWFIILLNILSPLEAQIQTRGYAAPIFMPQ